MSYATRYCAVNDFFTPIVCHVLQMGCCYNMVSDDVAVGYTVKFFDSKVVTKKPDSIVCMEKINHYYDAVSISIVEVIDK